MISSFFKTRKIKQFNFSARYYNEEKEERENRIAQIKAEMSGQNSPNYRPRINFKSEWTANKYATGHQKKSNIRLLISIAIVSLIVYLILFH
jgi:hypothetical protein